MNAGVVKKLHFFLKQKNYISVTKASIFRSKSSDANDKTTLKRVAMAKRVLSDETIKSTKQLKVKKIKKMCYTARYQFSVKMRQVQGGAEKNLYHCFSQITQERVEEK